MIYAFRIFFLSIISFFTVFAQSNLAPNPGFEDISNQTPKGWQVKTQQTQLYIDQGVFYSGTSAIKLEHKTARSSKLMSDALVLEVGQLYRLSAKIRTNNVTTDQYAQYPTPVGACISMESFPFTNHSPAVGGSKDWQSVEVYFYAVSKKDRIVLTLGYNGDATGTAWFDDITLEATNDLAKIIDPNSVRFYKKAYRYEDKGWINVHIEGNPYDRGMQLGFLTANEIKEFINKLSYSKQKENPQSAWTQLRTSTDLIFFRKFEPEYIEEMKGIADGVNKAGVQIFNRKLDVLDIVTLNSEIDLDYAGDAIKRTEHHLSGKQLQSAEGDNDLKDRLHKCSGMMATNSATTDKRVVFGQLFMWGGYTGPHWNVMVDVKPENGNRLVYQSFPGGIHSGADFYLNSAGIIIGETTVGQTPFDINGTPQSNRIRKAAQYANSIDDVVRIMTTNNNGLYTNDWLIADVKTDEIAILLLGTKKHKLWRSSKNEFYGDQKDWYWSNNNTKDLEVRKEYIVNDDNAPVDLSFRPWDRDLAFYKFYQENKGSINAEACINLWNSSPINRPHACDGKVVTSEMAEKMLFFANYGKVTLREMFVNENGRIPDLPGAIPRLSLGYATINPLFVEKFIGTLKSQQISSAKTTSVDLDQMKEYMLYPKELLWQNTVFPASNKENWFSSASAAYWNTLNQFTTNESKNALLLSDELQDNANRYNYIQGREMVTPAAASQFDYGKYGTYYIPRAKGIFILHQLRLFLGNKVFSDAMQSIHSNFKEKNVSNSEIISQFEKSSGKQLKALFTQWLDRVDIPEFAIKYTITNLQNQFSVKLNCKQDGTPYTFSTSIGIETVNGLVIKKIICDKSEQEFEFILKDSVLKVKTNPGYDVLTAKKFPYSFTNFFDDFSKCRIVYGTAKEIEANHTLALRFSKTLADRFTEKLIPVEKDNELPDSILKQTDLILLGNNDQNGLMKKISEQYGFKFGLTSFQWQGKIYGENDEGIFLCVPNPYNAARIVYIFHANSSLQLYQMLKAMQRMPGYAVFKSDQIIHKGFLPEN